MSAYATHDALGTRGNTRSHLVHGVDGGDGWRQQRHTLRITTPGSQNQRAGAVLVGEVGVGAGVKQRFGHQHAAGHLRKHEGGLANLQVASCRLQVAGCEEARHERT